VREYKRDIWDNTYNAASAATRRAAIYTIRGLVNKHVWSKIATRFSNTNWLIRRSVVDDSRLERG
jgi:hypothetical protein